MGYEPTDHWIILDHWITKGSHMSSSCLVYNIVIFVKLSAIKNTCRKRSYYIYNTYIAFCLLETKHQIIWSNHFITKRPSRLAGKGSESLLCEAAGSFATRGGWAAAWDSGDGQNLSPVGPQIFEYIYIYICLDYVQYYHVLSIYITIIRFAAIPNVILWMDGKSCTSWELLGFLWNTVNDGIVTG